MVPEIFWIIEIVILTTNFVIIMLHFIVTITSYETMGLFTVDLWKQRTQLLLNNSKLSNWTVDCMQNKLAWSVHKLAPVNSFK